jgi:hypothetical protein
MSDGRVTEIAQSAILAYRPSRAAMHHSCCCLIPCHPVWLPFPRCDQQFHSVLRLDHQRNSIDRTVISYHCDSSDEGRYGVRLTLTSEIPQRPAYYRSALEHICRILRTHRFISLRRCELDAVEAPCLVGAPQLSIPVKAPVCTISGAGVMIFSGMVWLNPGVAVSATPLGKGQLSEEKRTEKILERMCMALPWYGSRREHPTADNAPRTLQAHTRHHECVANSTDRNRTHESEGSVWRRSQNYRCSGLIERSLRQVRWWDGGCNKDSCQEEQNENPIASPQVHASVPNTLAPPPQRSNCQNYQYADFAYRPALGSGTLSSVRDKRHCELVS